MYCATWNVSGRQMSGKSPLLRASIKKGCIGNFANILYECPSKGACKTNGRGKASSSPLRNGLVRAWYYRVSGWVGRIRRVGSWWGLSLLMGDCWFATSYCSHWYGSSGCRFPLSFIRHVPWPASSKIWKIYSEIARKPNSPFPQSSVHFPY